MTTTTSVHAIQTLGTTANEVVSTSDEQPGIQSSLMPSKQNNLYNFKFMNISQLLRDSFRHKSKVRLLGELTNEKTLFLSLTETFLNSNIVDSEIQMEGFNIIQCDKSERIGGGVCFYLKKSIYYTTLLSYSNSICEVLIVKLTNPDVILVTMYSPPNATAASFNDIISQTEHKICALHGPLPEVIIMAILTSPEFNGIPILVKQMNISLA